MCIRDRYICDRVCELEYDALKVVCERLDAIRAGGQEACEQLMYALLLSGLAMQMVGHSRPCLLYTSEPLAMAAVAAGADGLIIEVHNNPAKALSDGAQSLTPDQFDRVAKRVFSAAKVLRAED